MLVRMVLVMAGLLAAVLVGREAPNFLVVEGMLGIGIIAAVALALALLQKR
jgi:hypothetical protein